MDTLRRDQHTYKRQQIANLKVNKDSLNVYFPVNRDTKRYNNFSNKNVNCSYCKRIGHTCEIKTDLKHQQKLIYLR